MSHALGHIRRAVHLRLNRQIPEVEAGCGKAARPVLCGGRVAICVPTAIFISWTGCEKEGGVLTTREYIVLGTEGKMGIRTNWCRREHAEPDRCRTIWRR